MKLGFELSCVGIKLMRLESKVALASNTDTLGSPGSSRATWLLFPSALL